ncbi:MAG: glycosyltransferase family 2 protein [Chloroflexia bacterium]|nr:glycosyltransferase family 2 protein [Chloroflexia bacterium]
MDQPLSGESIPRIAAVIPALNEAPSIARVVEGLSSQVPLELHRIIVVDNGSDDETGERARRAGAEVVREERRGYACRAGLLAATGADVIVLLDGDAADDPADLPRVLQPLLSREADLVVGSRALGTMEAGSMTPQQVFGNRLAALIMRHRYGLRVSDLGPLRAIRRGDLLALEMREMTYGWSVEMMVKSALAGLRYREVPVHYRRRDGRKSKVGGTLSGSARAGWCILSTTFRYSRWTPQRDLGRSRNSASELPQ